MIDKWMRDNQKTSNTTSVFLVNFRLYTAYTEKKDMELGMSGQHWSANNLF